MLSSQGLPTPAPTTVSFLWGRTPSQERKSPSPWHPQLGTCWKSVVKTSRNLPAAQIRASAPSARAEHVRRLLLRRWGLTGSCRPNARESGGSGPRTPPGLGQRVPGAELAGLGSSRASALAASSRHVNLSTRPWLRRDRWCSGCGFPGKMLLAGPRRLGKITESGARALGTPAPEPREPAPRASAPPSCLPARFPQFAFLPQAGPELILFTCE